MEQMGWSDGRFLIDGFPRSQENLRGWNQLMAGKVEELFTVFFDCDQGIMAQRLLERGHTSGRIDDDFPTIQKRLATFQ
jgi:UMP-CMP kinase